MDTNQMAELKDALRSLSNKLEGLNVAPAPAQAADEMERAAARAQATGASLPTTYAAANRILTADDRFELETKLKEFSLPQLDRMLAMQLRKGSAEGQGTPLTKFLGNAAFTQALDESGILSKAGPLAGADVGGTLVRQDLEPLLYAIFVKRFPFYDFLRSKPSNGLVHAYNRKTGYGAAQWITDLGTVTDDMSTYVRATAPVGILSTRRGISLKAQAAVRQGGNLYDAEAEEIRSGTIAVVNALQIGLLRGNASLNVSGTASTEDGAYDVNSIDGLRGILGASGVSRNKGGSETYVEGINAVVTTVVNNGGSPSVLVMRQDEHTKIVNEELANKRYLDSVEVVPGVTVNAIQTSAGKLPILAVPGGAIGTYVLSTVTYSDIYVLDTDTLARVWLGTDQPTVLDIPIGTNGALTHLYIIFMMSGLEVAAPTFNAKLRCQ